jgi:Protein of unknown function (DUF2934)
MAPRKSTTTTRTPSKRTGTKAEIGSAAPIAGAAGFGSNGHPASKAATHAQIEFRAYEIFLARGGAHRDDLADWFKAERELNS